MNALAPILRYARTRPHTIALKDGGREITYRELAALTARTAAHLSAIGVVPRDRVGLRLRDTADHIIALLAVARIGAVAVPLDWRARPAENARLVAAADIEHLLVEPGSRLAAGCHCIALDAIWHRAVARAEPAAELPAEWGALLVISASSGSTGEPKLTSMTHLQYHFAMAGMFEVMGLAGRHRYLSTLPLYYSGGRNSCLAHLLRGDGVILYPNLFAGAEYADVARRENATAGVVVPSMLRQLLNSSEREARLPEAMALFCAGAPLHAEEKRAALRRLTPNFQERYGTAETLAIAVLRPGDIAERAASVGQPHSLAEIEVVDDDDRSLPDGTAGRLRCRGPGLASPLPGPAENNFRGGWFYPGEIAGLDQLGYLFLQGRTAEVIIRSGAKVFPAEVEQVLLDHPDIIEAAVIGRPGAGGEEDVVAFVVSRREPWTGELLAHCRTRLTPHKVPRQIHFLPRLPKGTAGKVDKRALARFGAESGSSTS
jgi:acyl-coenzyme A synthetase/AMP-(fatty) acid ligase